MVAENILFYGGWLLEVKCKKEEECVSQNWESESVLSRNHTGSSVLTL